MARTDQPAFSGKGYEYAMHQNPEPYGPTYDIVMSQKTGEVVDRQDPHWTGDLLPSAHSRSDDRPNEFFTGESVMG